MSSQVNNNIKVKQLENAYMQWRFYRGGMGWPKKVLCHPLSHPKWKYELFVTGYALYLYNSGTVYKDRFRQNAYSQ